MYLALFRAKICPECGASIWPLGRLKLNKNVRRHSTFVIGGRSVCICAIHIYSPSR
jgi:hypothetical protein